MPDDTDQDEALGISLAPQVQYPYATPRLRLDGKDIHKIFVGSDITISAEEYADRRRMRDQPPSDDTPIKHISTSAMEPTEVIELLDAIQLTEDEDLVLSAIRLLEPRISAIRPTLSRQQVGRLPTRGRHGVILRLDGVEQVLPIGTMGDGAWRILGLALAITAARKGFLLVGEIDKGFHYSVMEKMWKLIVTAAERFDVTVFATSHSRDCYESLASVVDAAEAGWSRVTIQRVEPSRNRAVAFNEQDIVNAERRGIEVR